ncbi:MAG: VWA domain-containing protein [Bacteroidia bacterium]|nr:VWA domain-containing protein [Bacteroidia bacterium]
MTSNIFKTIQKIVFLIIALVIITPVFSQNKKANRTLTRILFVLDASQSMSGKWEKSTKMDISKRLLLNMLDSLGTIENIDLALRVYGHQSQAPPAGPQDCNDTKLEVPFSRDNVSIIKQKIVSIVPKGTTPIARSLELCGNDFPESGYGRNIIIIITDGIEACDGDPCAVSRELQKKGIVLKPFVIGVDMDAKFKKSFECVGSYYDATNEVQFKEVLNVIISQVLNSTTAQVNLLDINSQPTETNVPMTFIDKFSGAIKYNYVHTLNHRGNPDTLQLDPLIIYKLIVHTIPPVTADSITLIPGKHKVIPVDAPQGNLVIKLESYNQNKPIYTIVRKFKEMETLNLQEATKSEKYIVGRYDLEILTLPRLIIDDVDIKQSYTTTVEIPKPGVVNFQMPSPGYASVFADKDNSLEWICNLNQTMNSEMLTMLPGRYKVIYRSKNTKMTTATVEKQFKIVSGTTITVNLQ